jgi:hypothetical protein
LRSNLLTERRERMADLLFAVVTIASFAVLIAFVYGCAKL